MPAKNYYVVLGVSRGESPEGIRAAYHELASRIHPDLAGPADTVRFHEIDEAYEALSDPSRRRAVDRELGGPNPRESFELPITPEPVSLLGQPEETRPSFDAFRERYIRNFTDRHVPKAEKQEGLTLEVALSPLEAFCGCAVSVGVPVFERCGECGGTGEVFPFRCVSCAGSGLAEGRRDLQVHIPPRIPPGAILELPLEMFGIRNLYLRVRVSISGQAA